MYVQSSILRQQARESLKGKWGLAVGATAILLLVSIVPSLIPGVGPIIGLLIKGPFALGFAGFVLLLSRGQEVSVEKIFDGFHYFATALFAFILMAVFVLLWTLLLIVPGIIAAFSYSMTFFIMADDHTLGAREAIKKSKLMMQGNKMRFFLLTLTFIGWYLLAMLTLGIGFLWLVPYVQVTLAKFYDELKNGQAVSS